MQLTGSDKRLIEQSSTEERTIRLPAHAAETLEKIRAAKVRLFSRLAREPTNYELAEELNLTVDQILDISRKGRPAIGTSCSMADMLHDPYDCFRVSRLLLPERPLMTQLVNT